MKGTMVAVLAGVGFMAAACVSKPGGPPGPVLTNGVMVYGDGVPATITCDARPIQLNGNRANTRVVGNCGFVRVAGEHNDLTIEVAAGGTIEITGAHNDVTWVQTVPGRAPVLEDHGASNTFHRGRTL